jgi:hypothetical protein
MNKQTAGINKLSKAQSLSQSKDYPPFMEPKGSLHCSQRSAIGPDPEPDKSSPLSHRTSLGYILMLFFNLYLSLAIHLFPSGFPNKIS